MKNVDNTTLNDIMLKHKLFLSELDHIWSINSQMLRTVSVDALSLGSSFYSSHRDTEPDDRMPNPIPIPNPG